MRGTSMILLEVRLGASKQPYAAYRKVLRFAHKGHLLRALFSSLPRILQVRTSIQAKCVRGA